MGDIDDKPYTWIGEKCPRRENLIGLEISTWVENNLCQASGSKYLNMEKAFGADSQHLNHKTKKSTILQH